MEKKPPRSGCDRGGCGGMLEDMVSLEEEKRHYFERIQPNSLTNLECPRLSRFPVDWKVPKETGGLSTAHISYASLC